jgi:hypothetical protein
MDQAPFQNHALLWLACLADMGEAEAPQSWDFSPWMAGLGAAILESLQLLLTARWVNMKRQKARIREPASMRRFGELQFQLLAHLFDAAETADRRDLCRFFLIAVEQLLREPDSARPQYQIDTANLKMAERMEVHQAAGACFRQMERMGRWNLRARGIGYYDEGYAAAQLWKADWEDLAGDRLCAESRARLHALEPLGSPASITDDNNAASASASH